MIGNKYKAIWIKYKVIFEPVLFHNATDMANYGLTNNVYPIMKLTWITPRRGKVLPALTALNMVNDGLSETPIVPHT